MRQLIRTLVGFLNSYSWSMIIAFIGAVIAMQYHTVRSLEGFFLTLPLVITAIVWSELRAPLLKADDSALTKKTTFYRDLFLITFSFLLSGFLSLWFEYNNSDVRGWWPLIVYFNGSYGILFAFIFSKIARFLPKNHKIYTFVFSFAIVVYVSFASFFPYNLSILSLGRINTFFLVLCLLIALHLLFALIYQVYRCRHKHK